MIAHIIPVYCTNEEVGEGMHIRSHYIYYALELKKKAVPYSKW